MLIKLNQLIEIKNKQSEQIKLNILNELIKLNEMNKINAQINVNMLIKLNV